jgi:predicted PurR-regulated permease PerM
MDIWEKIKKFIIESLKATGIYFYSKLLTSMIIAFVSFAVFQWIGIRLSGLLSAILGIANMIPVFGPWAGVFLCALISVFQQPVYALYTVLTAISLQFLDEFFMLPLIAGKKLDLKPMVIVLAVIGGSMLLGFWGVVFAVPIAAAVKIGYGIFTGKTPRQ